MALYSKHLLKISSLPSAISPITLKSNNNTPMMTNPLIKHKSIFHLNHRFSRNDSSIKNFKAINDVMSIDSLVKQKNWKNQGNNSIDSFASINNLISNSIRNSNGRRSIDNDNKAMIKELKLILESKKKKLLFAKANYNNVKEEYELAKMKNDIQDDINRFTKQIDEMQTNNINLMRLIRESNKMKSEIIAIEGNETFICSDVNSKNNSISGYSERWNKCQMNYNKKTIENKEIIEKLTANINEIQKELETYNESNRESDQLDEIAKASQLLNEIKLALQGTPDDILSRINHTVSQVNNIDNDKPERYKGNSSSNKHHHKLNDDKYNQTSKSVINLKPLTNHKYIFKKPSINQSMRKKVVFTKYQSINELPIAKVRNIILNNSTETVFHKEKEELMNINTNLLHKIRDLKEQHEIKANEITVTIKENTHKVKELHYSNLILKKEIDTLMKHNK